MMIESLFLFFSSLHVSVSIVSIVVLSYIIGHLARIFTTEGLILSPNLRTNLEGTMMVCIGLDTHRIFWTIWRLARDFGYTTVYKTLSFLGPLSQFFLLLTLLGVVKLMSPIFKRLFKSKRWYTYVASGIVMVSLLMTVGLVTLHQKKSTVTKATETLVPLPVKNPRRKS